LPRRTKNDKRHQQVALHGKNQDGQKKTQTIRRTRSTILKGTTEGKNESEKTADKKRYLHSIVAITVRRKE
jgi:hypothetical protein